MNILAPIGQPEEVEMLAENGANEFFCGITPSEWIAKFTPGVWINRRNPFAGLPSFQHLEELVKKAHHYKIPVFVTLNAPYYTEEQYPILLELIKICTEQIGIDAFVVSDIGLMIAMKQHVPAANIHVSSLAAPLNSGAIQLYKELGAERIVLPRSVQLNEIKELKQKAGDSMEIEVFVLNDGCVYEEGFCMTTHNRVSAFCAQAQWDYEYVPALGNRKLKDGEQEKLNEQLNHYREYVYFVNDSGGQIGENGLPMGPCGLCAIPSLYEIGVDSLKIVGREGSPYRKLASVQVVNEIVKRVKMNEPKNDVIEKCLDLRNQPKFCESGLMCYYR